MNPASHPITTARFARNPRPPKEFPPPQSCDCQLHVFADPKRYPGRAGTAYDPPAAANLDALRAGLRTIGVERGIIVQATVYGTDHRLLLDSLAAAGKNFRGIAIVDDSVSDADLERMHAAGVRGARFNFWKFLNMVPPEDEFLRSVDRMREFGWHAKIHAQPDELREMQPLLRKVRIPIVIDHMAKLDFDQSLDHPDTRFVLEALRHENWWVMLSNGMRHMPPPWDGAITYGKALYEAAPDRSIWGSDWPHLGMHGPDISEDADNLELVYQYAPTAEGRRNVLVTNPAKLFGFDD